MLAVIPRLPSITPRNAVREKILRYIRDRLYQNSLSPGDIQSAFQLSRPTLYRMFEVDGGLVEYIRNCRLQDAEAELLTSSALAIIDIAYRTGFNSGSDFSRAFRRAYGVTPREFRRQGKVAAQAQTQT